MPFSLLLILCSWCVLGFFFCLFGIYLEQFFIPAEFFYISLKSVYSYLLDQNPLMIIQSYILYSPIFFKSFFEIIGLVVSSFLYQISFLLCSFCNIVIKFLKFLKISLVVFDLSRCFSLLKSFIYYLPSASFILNNITKYASYFFISLLDQLVKLIRFSIVTVISLLIVLVLYTLLNHKVVLKYVITIVVLGIILLVALGLV